MEEESIHFKHILWQVGMLPSRHVTAAVRCRGSSTIGAILRPNRPEAVAPAASSVIQIPGHVLFLVIALLHILILFTIHIENALFLIDGSGKSRAA